MGKPSKDTVLKAIKGSGGVVSRIAEALKVEWHTAKTYINEWEETKQAYSNEEETILDEADSALYDAVKEKEAWAVKWIQSTKGKKRGYVEKSELGITGDGSLNVHIFQLPDNGREQSKDNQATTGLSS